jgi:hypothetical protein
MAPPKPKTPTLLPPATPRTRDSSPELGSPSKITQYNKQTGRPVRKSAGKIKKVAGFVDFEDDEFGPLTTDGSEDEDEEEEEMDARGRSDKKKRVTKRKRSPSPPSPRLEPLVYEQELEELTDNEEGGAFHRHTPKASIRGTICIPLLIHRRYV